MDSSASSSEAPIYDILLDDADGRQLRLESVDEIEKGRVRLTLLAACYLGMGLILRNQQTHTVWARTAIY